MRVLLASIFALLSAAFVAPAVGLEWSAASGQRLLEYAALEPQHGLAPRQKEMSLLQHALAERDTREITSRANQLFLGLARDFATGRVPPKLGDQNWRIPIPPIDENALLSRAAAARDPIALLDDLVPPYPVYGALRNALARVQQEPTGVRDAAGRKREDRIASIEASMERLRWLPRDWPSPRIVVNIPAFALTLVKSDAPPENHDVIVGAVAHPTPVFTASVEAVTLNPSWTVPPSILRRKILPQAQRDRTYLERNGFDLIGPGERLRQRPGPQNALGIVKLEMPNAFSVFIHDTPEQHLFEKAARPFSSGCIRTKNAVGLAASILQTDPQWPRNAIDSALAAGATKHIKLGQPLPVFVLYQTAVLDTDGQVVFLDDVYRRDPRLARLLEAPPRPASDIDAMSIAALTETRQCAKT